MKWILRLGCVTLLLVAAVVAYVAWNDQGVISVRYAETTKPSHRTIKAALEEKQLFNLAAAAIDTAFLIPRDLHVVFTDCGEVNAKYDPARSTLVMCYELAERLVQDYRRYAPADSLVEVAVWQTLLFVFYHELSHALIDVLDLPVTGREEDAADQLATLVLLEAGPDGRDAALRGAEWFAFKSGPGSGRLRLWDEHSLDEQRYFNVLCWVYGADPKAHAALLGRDWRLPPDRATRCPAEFDRMNRAWSSVLMLHRY